MQEGSSPVGFSPASAVLCPEKSGHPIDTQAECNGHPTPPTVAIADHSSSWEARQEHVAAAGQHMVAADNMSDKLITTGSAQKSRAQLGKKRIAEKGPQQGKGGAQTAAAEDVQGKPKRKYVKSGRFVGKFKDYQKQKQARADQTGKAAGKRQNKQAAAAPAEMAETAKGGTAASLQLARALESPFASESSQETPPHAKRGRPKGAAKNSKTPTQGAAKKSKTPTHTEAGREAEPAKAAAPAAAASRPRARRSNGSKQSAANGATPEPEVAANVEAAGEAAGGSNDQVRSEREAEVAANMEAVEEAAGGNDDRVKSEMAADVAARLDMARKASTGEGSRLERPAADSDDTSLSQLDSRQAESKQDAGTTDEGGTVLNGTRVFNPVSTASKPPHRLSKVTGREMLGSGGVKGGGPNGESDGPLHRDDSTFGEYMAALDGRSSSGNGVRRLNSSGNSGRLLEMLHGSDGWGKLVSELQQKEEDDAQQAAVQAEEQQQPPLNRRKRGRTPKGSSDPLAQATRQHQEVVEGAAASGNTTEDSQTSRPKRALPRFDYNVLNGTSGNLNAMLHAADMQQQSEQGRPKVHKKRKPKLDKDGNKPEVSVYARAYNKVKAQFTRIRREDTLLGVYGADAWGGASQERVKLQFELDRAREQVEKCKTIIRECVKFCEEAEGDRAIPSEHYDSDGELPEKYIFCAKCLKGESEEDNDIVLCDGACNRGYHEQCLQPRVHAQELPEDEGWLCPACDAKADIILAINEEYGTDYDQEAAWHSLFAEDPHQAKERAASRNGPVTFLNMELGDSDSDDSSFGSDDLSDQEGEAAAPTEGDQPVASESHSPRSRESGAGSESSSGSDTSSASELADLEDEQEGLLSSEVDETAPRAKRDRAAASSPHDTDPLEERCGTSGLSTSEGASDLVTGKRKRKAIDYKALNDSMFGNIECYEGEGLEEDDDFDPAGKRQRHASVSE